LVKIIFASGHTIVLADISATMLFEIMLANIRLNGNYDPCEDNLIAALPKFSLKQHY